MRRDRVFVSPWVVILLACGLLTAAPREAAAQATWRLTFIGEVPCPDGRSGRMTLTLTASNLTTDNPVRQFFSDEEFFREIAANGGGFGLNDHAGSVFEVSGCGVQRRQVEQVFHGFIVEPGGRSYYVIQSSGIASGFTCGSEYIPVYFDAARIQIYGRLSGGQIDCRVGVAGPNRPLPDLGAPSPAPSPSPSPTPPPAPTPPPSSNGPLRIVGGEDANPLDDFIVAPLRDAADGKFKQERLLIVGGVPPYRDCRVVGMWPAIRQEFTALMDGGTCYLRGMLRGNYSTPSIFGSAVYSIDVEVSDSAGNTARKGFRMEILAPLDVAPLAGTPIVMPVGTQGAWYSHTINAYGGNDFKYPKRWNVTGTLPRGLRVETTSGLIPTLYVTGRPEESGTFTLEITVDDGISTQSPRKFAVITVLPGRTRPLTIPPTVLAPGVEGQELRRQLMASGGSGDYTFRLLSSPPRGLTLSPSGELVGVPGESSDTPFELRVQVSDSAGSTVTATVFLRILPAPGSPLRFSGAAAPPPAHSGHPYNARLEPVGGTPPYQVALDPSSEPLPDGMLLSSSGVLSGVPMQPVRRVLTFRVADALGNTSWRSFEVVVDTVPPPTIGSVAPTGTRVGDGPFVLEIAGAGFSPDSRIEWNGEPLPTSGSSTLRAATISPDLVATPGNVTLVVRNGSGELSPPATFAVLGTDRAMLIAPAPGATLAPSTTFRWLRSEASEYRLIIGDQGPASSNMLDHGLAGTADSVTVTNLPTDGRTLYVRLATNLPGGWQAYDYTFRSGESAAAPAPPAPAPPPASPPTPPPTSPPPAQPPTPPPATPPSSTQLDDNERSTRTEWGWWYGVTPEQLGSQLNQGYRLSDLQVDSGNPLRFTALLVRNSGAYGKGWWWYYGATAADVSRQLTTNNARLIDLEAYDDGAGNTRFAVVMIPNTGNDAASWAWQYNTSPGEIQDYLTRNPGMRLIDFDRYVINGATYHSAVYIGNSGGHQRTWWWYWNISPDQLSSTLGNTGAMIVKMEPAGNGNFDVILQRVPGGNPRWWYWYGVDAAFVGRTATENNARIIELKRTGDRFIAVLVDNTQ